MVFGDIRTALKEHGHCLLRYAGKEPMTDAGIKSTIKAMDQVFNRIVDDINCGRSLDWLSEEKDSYK